MNQHNKLSFLDYSSVTLPPAQLLIGQHDQAIVPDLTIFVRIPVEIALERCNNRGSLSAYEKKEFLHRVAQGFEEIYKNRDNVIIVDGIETSDFLTEQALNTITQWIQNKNLLF